ncbi:MAG: hypothetical protein MUO40_09770 [Anaerolineaceae bacterium]|nr:hypothetical protein [Anaerolineaceae bacterium]
MIEAEEEKIKRFSVSQKKDIIDRISRFLEKKEGWSDNFRSKIMQQFRTDYIDGDKEDPYYIYYIIMFGRMHGYRTYFF